MAFFSQVAMQPRQTFPPVEYLIQSAGPVRTVLSAPFCACEHLLSSRSRSKPSDEAYWPFSRYDPHSHGPQRRLPRLLHRFLRSAAFFTQIALFVEPEGVFSGREAIENAVGNMFPRWGHQLFERGQQAEFDRQWYVGSRTMVAHSQGSERSRAHAGLLVRNLCA